MSIVTEVLDRISGFAVLNARLQDMTREVMALRTVVIEHERAIAELKGQNRALIQMQSSVAKRGKSE
jgi:hypothetical protein